MAADVEQEHGGSSWLESDSTALGAERKPTLSHSQDISGTLQNITQ